MKISKFNHILSLNLILTILVGCSSESFNKKIETNEIDLLSEESFMRYNSTRLDQFSKADASLISKAVASCHQSKFIKGKDILEDIMHENKSNPFYWNALGTCYYLDKQFAKAIFYYDLALEAKDQLKDSQKNLADAIISNNIGLIHLNFKRYHEAFDSFKKSSDLAPQYMTPRFNMAQIYIEFNDNEKALELLKQCETGNPYDVDLLYSLALIYFKQNNLDKSFTTMKKIKNDYLIRPDIVGLYAYNLMKKNRLDEAKNIIEKRMYADEYNQRNKYLLEEINQKINDQQKISK